MVAKRVLIVDDERLAHISLADFLHESGYGVVAVSNGESAARQQQQQSLKFEVPTALQEMGLAEHRVVHKPVMDMGVFVALIDAELSQNQES